MLKQAAEFPPVGTSRKIGAFRPAFLGDFGAFDCLRQACAGFDDFDLGNDHDAERRKVLGTVPGGVAAELALGQGRHSVASVLDEVRPLPEEANEAADAETEKYRVVGIHPRTAERELAAAGDARELASCVDPRDLCGRGSRREERSIFDVHAANECVHDGVHVTLADARGVGVPEAEHVLGDEGQRPVAELTELKPDKADQPQVLLCHMELVERVGHVVASDHEREAKDRAGVAEHFGIVHLV